MSNGAACPECEQKIILDGDLAAAIFTTTCERIEKYLDAGNHLAHPELIVEKLIAAENAAFEFQRAVLEGMKYPPAHLTIPGGPWPKCLQ